LKFEDKEKAAILHKQFCGVFIKEMEEIPVLEKSITRSFKDSFPGLGFLPSL
jgi:hypothetical protein